MESGHDVVARLRQIFMAFPEVTERASHGAPAWFVRSSPQFATVWEHGHHEDEFPHMWCAAPLGAQQELIASAPERYFRPPYVGHRGWVGVRLDGDLDWAELAEVAEDAYRAVAPKTLVARLDAERGG